MTQPIPPGTPDLGDVPALVEQADLGPAPLAHPDNCRCSLHPADDWPLPLVEIESAEALGLVVRAESPAATQQEDLIAECRKGRTSLVPINCRLGEGHAGRCSIARQATTR